MRNLSVLFAFFGILTVYSVGYSADHECGPWANTGRTCIFGDYNTSWRWVRDCSNSSEQCGPRHMNPILNTDGPCDSEDICLPPVKNNPRTPMDPNYDFGICTEWERHHGVSCSDDDGNLINGKWIRACKRANISTDACSRTKPADWPEDE